LNKIDMLPDSADKVAEFVQAYGWQGRVFAISAISGTGCKELTYAIMDHIDQARVQREAEAAVVQTAAQPAALPGQAEPVQSQPVIEQ
jgi:GTPase